MWLWVLANWGYWMVVLVLAVLAVRAGANAATVALTTFCLVLLAGLALGLTNYGIVVRMRATLMVAVLPLVFGLLRAPSERRLGPAISIGPTARAGTEGDQG